MAVRKGARRPLTRGLLAALLLGQTQKRRTFRHRGPFFGLPYAMPQQELTHWTRLETALPERSASTCPWPQTGV